MMLVHLEFYLASVRKEKFEMYFTFYRVIILVGCVDGNHKMVSLRPFGILLRALLTWASHVLP